MINIYEVTETNQMIAQENLDVRTITLGISLMDCIDSDLDRLNEKIYTKITTLAKDLVKDITKTFVEILTLEIKDPYYILEDVEKKIRDRISFKIRKSTGKDPLIIPAIVELK